MLRRLAMSAAALLTALAPALLPTPAAGAAQSGAAAGRGPGQVCFWTGAGQHGDGWCYGPPGYADVPEFLHDRAASFRSDVNRDLYAIDWGRDACYYRLIRAYDFSDNWSWGSRIDGVADTPMGCEVS
ncbi:hypothetical protein ACWGI8_14535 [Streptomyces sp. NPDC054841]